MAARGITVVTYIKITGWRQKTSWDGEVKWLHTLLTDEASNGDRGTVIIEARHSIGIQIVVGSGSHSQAVWDALRNTFRES